VRVSPRLERALPDHAALTLIFWACAGIAGNFASAADTPGNASSAGTATASVARAPAGRARSIVIVHGAFADGSGWEGVYRILTRHGYDVTMVQNSTVSLAADVTATRNVLANQTGPVVLVGHSYGGEVITQAGDDPKVKSLVYVSAYAPDAGESLQSMTAKADASVPAPPILPPSNGFLLLDRAQFPAAFAADVERHKAQFMAAAQVPLGLQTFAEKVTTAAWKSKPSYFIISSDDRMIPPADEKMMATRARSVQFEFKASHAVYISRPADVAKVIEKAASD
jgi:pimeloyl-ACP methyl ester carboxylesterase